MNNIEEKIIQFYFSKIPQKKEPLTQTYDHIINWNPGLGDSLSLTHLPFAGHLQEKQIHIQSFSPHFDTLIKFNPYYESCTHHATFMRGEFLQGYYNCGNGHFFQRLQRACGLEPLVKPKAFLLSPELVATKTNKNKIILHFNVGAHATVQKQTIHPRAREFYPEHKATLQQWILDYQSFYEFVEVGTEFSNLMGVENKIGLSLEDTILEMASAEYYIGLHSGVMHIAAALGLKSIVIINFPAANQLYLPALKDLSIPDLDWLYPQNIHLHEDEGADLVPKFSYENLNTAILGGIYPFWNDKYLNLINEYPNTSKI